MCLGSSAVGQRAFVRRMSGPERDLVYLIATTSEFADLMRGTLWTSVQANQADSSWHRDKGNKGPSVIFAVGNYEIGRFLVEGRTARHQG
jgi:hypothetical protein